MRPVSAYRKPMLGKPGRGRQSISINVRSGWTLAARRGLAVEHGRSVLYRYVRKARAAGLELDMSGLPHLKKLRGPDGERRAPLSPIPVTWWQCDPECPGWLHMDSGAHGNTIQACDDCGRFTVWDRAAELDPDGQPVPGWASSDDRAADAHALECGCSWGVS